MYDVIVVGARCAGAPTAMLLARKGYRVLLLDRAKFPSDTLSTHFIQMPGMARLQRWGVLGRVMATGCPPITRAVIDIDGQTADADFPVPDEVPGLAAPRRTVLDKVLVDVAVEAGAELREGVMIDSLLLDDGRVGGVQGHTSSIPSLEEHARLVIGADGRNSVVARLVGAEMHDHTPALGGGYYSYWSGVDLKGAELFVYENQFTVAFPTNDDLATIAIAWPPEEYRSSRRDPAGSVLAALDRVGDLGERVRKGEREHELVGVGNLANFLRTPWGKGWALVGDAVYHKDPTPADGIADAFREADLLAKAADGFLSGALSEHEAGDRYRKHLEARAKPLLEKAVTMASFDETSVARATSFLEIQQMHAEETEEIVSGGELQEVAS